MIEDAAFAVWNSSISAFEKFSTDTLHMAPLTFLTICAFIGSLLLCFCCCIPLLCCCRCCLKKSFRHANGNENRRGLLALMFANLDEFESLTPLIVTPASSTSSLKQALKESSLSSSRNLPPSLSPVKSAFKPTKQQLIMAASASVSDSPPPPRRPNTGRTMIVPLTSANNRNLRPTQHIPMVVGTPDSRITSLDCGTTKSCATIPEDDELSVVSEDDRTNEIDLVSIDRTYVSTRQPCPAFRAPPTTGIHQFNPHVPIPETVPFKEKPPLYEPPAPPWEPPAPVPQRRLNLRLNTAQPSTSTLNNNNKKFGFPGRDSPGLSSPEASSCGALGSPVDTTGSLSDSFMVPSESDNRSLNGGGACYNLETGEQTSKPSGDTSSIDTDAQSAKKYQLHRIEEESENCDEGHREDLSRAPSNQSQDPNRAIPRSISQQLEFMKKQNLPR